MAEYIEREAALNASRIVYIECLYEDEENYLEGEIGNFHVVFARDIKAIPAADVVEVVRCKDCKHGDTGINEDGKFFWKCIGRCYGGVDPEWYCADGERRADNAD